MKNLCLKCGSELGTDHVCENCGLKVDVYEKIKSASNMLYNQGLQKAKLRDLSGAISILRRSLKLDKHNVDARNLLGLIYFELGEVVSALQQWVISKHIKEKDNIAIEYIERIHHNQHKLDTLNTAVKKYNQSLGYIHQNSEDLAIIQLKKVVSLNPKFVKAYCLLALCYIHQGSDAKAKKYLLKVLAIDKNNYIALKYYEAITEDEEEAEQALYHKQPEKKKEVAYSRPTVKKENKLTSSIMQVAYVIFGVVIGLAVAMFLINPGTLKGKTKEIDNLKKQITASATDYDKEVKSLTEENGKLKKELEAKVEEVNGLVGKEAYYDAVDSLQKATAYYLNNDLLASANELIQINSADLTSSATKELYQKLIAETYPKIAAKGYNEGYKLYSRGKSTQKNSYFEEALVQLKTAHRFGSASQVDDKVMYFIARCYGYLDEDQQAMDYYTQMINSYPDSKYKKDAQFFLKQLQNKNQ